MTQKTLARATEINDRIRYTKSDLKDIEYYEKNYLEYPVLIRLRRTGGTFGTASEISIFDEKLKQNILNLIKTSFEENIKTLEKEFEEL